jgi:hypothetical protein
MTYYEYDSDGWLVGWHTDAERSNSTAVSYAPIPASRARWVSGAWTEDPSRDQAEQLAGMRLAAIDAVQARLDNLAQSWGYDHILSLCTYASSKVPRFAAEGQIGVDWRDATWAAVDQHQNTVTSAAELFALLPAIPVRPTP